MESKRKNKEKEHKFTRLKSAVKLSEKRIRFVEHALHRLKLNLDEKISIQHTLKETLAKCNSNAISTQKTLSKTRAPFLFLLCDAKWI